MKTFVPLFSLMLLSSVLFAQTETKLTHHMSPEEEAMRHLIGVNFVPTDPPDAPVRMVAEYERMQSVLIRYPFGIPMELIVEMAEDCQVTTIVTGQSQENYVLGLYNSNGVNTDNCDFLHSASDSYWTRDYGPWFVVDGNHEMGICDFPYNRPRPNDDEIPVKLAAELGINLFGMDIETAGGNWMCDGLINGSQTDLIWEENLNYSHEEIDSLFQAFLGIENNHVMPDPLGEYIKHIDCWGKYLDVDKILIGQVGTSDPRYEDFEYVADYYANLDTPYGNKYQVYRVFTPGNYPYTPYTNSLILNKKVFVPITLSPYDDDALAVYEEAMPGYEVVGIYHNAWENTDALHCRTKGVADIGMLQIKHFPLLGEVPFDDEYNLNATIVPLSGSNVYEDSVFIRYQVNHGVFQTAPMTHVFGYGWAGSIPAQDVNDTISYIIHAADESGRSEDHPFIGISDPHEFIVTASDIVCNPDTLWFLDEQTAIDGLEVTISNFTDGDIELTDIEFEGYNSGFSWYADPVVVLPYNLTASDELVLTVYLNMNTFNHEGSILIDTMSIVSENAEHHVIIAVDEDILTAVANKQKETEVSIYPNPVKDRATIEIEQSQNAHVKVVVYSLNGQIITTLFDAELTSGKHSIEWDVNDQNGSKVPGGIYMIGISKESGDTQLKKLLVL